MAYSCNHPYGECCCSCKLTWSWSVQRTADRGDGPQGGGNCTAAVEVWAPPHNMDYPLKRWP